MRFIEKRDENGGDFKPRTTLTRLTQRNTVHSDTTMANLDYHNNLISSFTFTKVVYHSKSCLLYTVACLHQSQYISKFVFGFANFLPSDNEGRKNSLSIFSQETPLDLTKGFDVIVARQTTSWVLCKEFKRNRKLSFLSVSQHCLAD